MVTVRMSRNSTRMTRLPYFKTSSARGMTGMILLVGKIIISGMRWSRWTPVFTDCIWTAIQQPETTAVPFSQSMEQVQGIASFLYQNSVRSSVGNLNRIAEVGVLILNFEKESFTIAFWTRLSLIRLAQWFKDWTVKTKLSEMNKPCPVVVNRVVMLRLCLCGQSMSAFMNGKVWQWSILGPKNKRPESSRLRKEWDESIREIWHNRTRNQVLILFLEKAERGRVCRIDAVHTECLR